ncbi:MAG TPA: TolC family protein, partial [Gemmatimonadales bacterium]|nr:TolC family protein [Gemmatimonadales bacterium]
QEPLTLRRAIELAQSQGNQAVAAKAARDAVFFRHRAFSARQLPQLSFGGTLPRYNRAIIPVIQPDGSTLFRPQDQTDADLTATVSQQLPTGGDFFVSSSLATLSVTGDESFRTWSSTPISVGVRQDLFRPNTRGLDRREQPYRTELAERLFREAREEIALEVTNRFFDVHAAGVTLANATTNVAVNDTLYRLNTGRFEVGKIGENDLLQSELALLRARTALDGARLELERAKSALRLALGLAPGAPVELVVPSEVPAFPVDTALAVSEARRNRSTTTGAELSGIQAERRVTEARLNSGFGATVQASVGFNATGSAFEFAYRNLLEARQVVVSVDIPLVQWGARRAGVQAAEAEREEAERNARISVDQAAQDAHFAALQLEQSRRALAISAKADTVAAKRFEVAYNRYVIGRIAIDNLYVAQGEKDQALMQYGQALRAHWVAYFRLRRLTLYDFERGVPIQ